MTAPHNQTHFQLSREVGVVVTHAWMDSGIVLFGDTAFWLQSDAVGVRYLCIPGLARTASSFKKAPRSSRGKKGGGIRAED